MTFTRTACAVSALLFAMAGGTAGEKYAVVRDESAHGGVRVLNAKVFEATFGAPIDQPAMYRVQRSSSSVAAPTEASRASHALAFRRFGSKLMAIGDYEPTLLQTGWDTLKIETNPSASDEEQAWAAGYFEGSQTYQRAFDHYFNHWPTQSPAKVMEFLTEHDAWIQREIAARHAGQKPMTAQWQQVALLWRQWEGLFAGMSNKTNKYDPTWKWSRAQALLLTSMGDVFDLQPALNPHDEGEDAQPDWRKMPKDHYMRWFAKKTHCTSLFKVTGDLQDIFFGHVAWYNFNTLTRIFKHYTLNFRAAGTTAKTISMSSYPGMLSSFDDFYITDSGLAVIETSLAVTNYKIYDGNIRPDLWLYWTRTMVATRMAETAPEWTQLFSVLNSGTYNNQWMVLDMKKFTPGQTLKPDTMWVAEQLPGIVASQDVTSMLRYGYYPSYNVPMNRTIFEMSGYAEAVEKQGPEMNSYDMCVRARIFRRDQGKVTDMASYKHMMHYNNYEQDPVSNGNPLYAIASRVDLDPHAPECFGGLDLKVSSYSMWKQGQVAEAMSGPTPQQPRFGYNITRANCGQHRGLPEMYAFDWQKMMP